MLVEAILDVHTRGVRKKIIDSNVVTIHLLQKNIQMLVNWQINKVDFFTSPHEHSIMYVFSLIFYFRTSKIFLKKFNFFHFFLASGFFKYF
jgi:hypothetical protein